MKQYIFSITVLTFLTIGFQLNGMKRDNFHEGTDRSALTRPELKEKKNKTEKRFLKTEPKRKKGSMPAPEKHGLIAEPADAKRSAEETLSRYSEFYAELYQQFMNAKREGVFLRNQFFVELMYCRNTMPSSCLKLSRKFNVLNAWAAPLRFPEPAVGQARNENEDEDELDIPFDDLDLNAD